MVNGNGGPKGPPPPPRWDEEKFMEAYRAFQKEAAVENIIDPSVERAMRISWGVLVLAHTVHDRVKEALVDVGVDEASTAEVLAALVQVTAVALYSNSEGDSKRYAGTMTRAWQNACHALGKG